MKKSIMSAVILTLGILITAKTYVPILATNSVPAESCVPDTAAEPKNC